MRQGQGYLTIACNTPDINYLQHAYLLAESIKDTQQINDISLIANDRALAEIQDKHRKIFSNIIPIQVDETRKDFTAEAKVWHLSPYKQTIKIESDMIMSASIDHWWSIMDAKDIVFTTDVFKHDGTMITDRSQRQLFDNNLLPNIYTGLYYFRFSKDSQAFFSLVNDIYNNWEWFKNNLKNCRYDHPVTDEVFAIAANIWGIERCTLSQSVPAFVHMKNPLLGLPKDAAWWEYLCYEKSNGNVRIGNHQQHLPVHYCNKLFLEQCHDQ